MLGSAPGIAFLPSRDLERSRAFFEGLGLTVERQSPFACVLRAGATMLRVTLVERLRAQPFIVFGWQVEDIASMVGELSSAGIALHRYEGLERPGGRTHRVSRVRRVATARSGCPRGR